MARKYIDITGHKFNKLTTIKHIANEKWLFECECGKQVIKTASDVKRGNTISCSKICTTGNSSKHPLYQTWDGIKKRCYQVNATGYSNYGGRGIVMCDEWKNSFWKFVEDMGEKPFKSSSIERLNTNQNYYKNNCRWASSKEQAKNRRNNIYITYKNEIYTLYTLCKILNLKHSTIYWRLKKSLLSPQEYFNKNIF
jgi:hypothetical protein